MEARGGGGGGGQSYLYRRSFQGDYRWAAELLCQGASVFEVFQTVHLPLVLDACNTKNKNSQKKLGLMFNKKGPFQHWWFTRADPSKIHWCFYLNQEKSIQSNRLRLAIFKIQDLLDWLKASKPRTLIILIHKHVNQQCALRSAPHSDIKSD